MRGVVLVVLIAVNLALAGLVLRRLLSGPRSASADAWEGTRGQWFVVVPLLSLDIALMVFLIVRDYKLVFQMLGVLHVIVLLHVIRK